MEAKVRICDRDQCGRVIQRNDRYGRRITIHNHHDKTIDLCQTCYDAFAQFLTRGICFGAEYQAKINQIHEESVKFV